MAILSKNTIHGEKPQFGNPKHIAFVKRMERLHGSGSIVIKPTFSETRRVIYSMYFKWVCSCCGYQNTSGFENDVEDDFNGYWATCFSCEQRFINNDNTLTPEIK